MQPFPVQVQDLLICMHNQSERMAKTMVDEIAQLGSRIEALEKHVEDLKKGELREWNGN